MARTTTSLYNALCIKGKELYAAAHNSNRHTLEVEVARNLSNVSIYAMLGLVIVLIVGMLLSSWRLVLYPFLPIVGIGMLYGLTRAVKRNRALLLVPSGVVVLLAGLYGWLDAMSVADPDGEGLVIGFAPTTALYFFGVAPAFLLVGLLFALTFSQDAPEVEESAQTSGDINGEEGRSDR